MDVSDPSVFKYVVGTHDGDFFAKHGAYAELEQPILKDLDAVARVDGMVRVGNVLVSNPLSSNASVIRETLGVSYALDRNFRLKGSGELWQFSAASPTTGRTSEVSIHLGFVGTF